MTDVQTINDAVTANFMLVDVDISSWGANETDRAASRELAASKGATQDAARVLKNLMAGADAEQFEPGTYPTAAEIPHKFGVHVDLMPVPAMQDFSRINLPAQLVEALGQRFAKQSIANIEETYADIRQRILKEIHRIAGVLTKRGAGEKTKVYDTLTVNLNTLVGVLRGTNLANKPEIDQLADRIERELLATPIEALRESPSMAAQVGSAAQSIAADADMDSLWGL
jgi:hypothetical protein